ncbi:hypothetical protein F5Y10DRAFT_267748 [Nemania abortiva]|nr:hypothetical protein F5Y10DRAFT_267748 [Nemania abortiva]
MNRGSGAPAVAPVSGATLFAREIERRKGLRQRGTLPTGCSEIDDVLLLGGGFERGCVVGVSAEEVDFGVLFGLQTIARVLVFEDSPTGRPLSPPDNRRQRAAIITTLPVTTILPTLRDVIRSQAQVKLGARNPAVDAEVRRSLEAISISRIFDIEGLWEVLRELGQTQVDAGPNQNTEGSRKSESKADDGMTGSGSEKREDSAEAEAEQTETALADPIQRSISPEPTVLLSRPITQLPPLRIGPELRQPVRKSEILDSEDEEPLSSSPLSSPPPSTLAPDSLSPIEELPQSPAQPEPEPEPELELELELHHNSHPSPNPEFEERPQEPEVPSSPSPSPEEQSPPVPDIILVTHFSSLLTTLFTHNDKTSAHTNLQLLSSYLRDLAQSSSGPLIMLLNTTTSSPASVSTSTSTSTTRPNAAPPPGPEALKQHKPLDPTLRSIFNPIPISHPHGTGMNMQGHRPGQDYSHPYSATSASTRRNKPSFGATFAQFPDLHLLCTALPRTRDDAETAIALGPASADVRRAWVVEALLDEMGEGNSEGEGRGRDREGQKEEARPPPRVSREQRWAAVDVRDGVRIVNAFTAAAGGRTGGSVNRGPVRVVAGFGGPRV